MLAANTLAQPDEEQQALALVCSILLRAAERRRARLAQTQQRVDGDPRPAAITTEAEAEQP